MNLQSFFGGAGEALGLGGTGATIHPPFTAFASRPLKVLVTGAGGRTGTIVVRKLLEHGKEKILPRALVRSPNSEEKLKQSLGEFAGDLEIVQGDITKPASMAPAFKDVDAVIICSSATPSIDKTSLPGVILTKIFTLGMVSKRPSFWYEENGSPELVDWVAQRDQVDAAKSAGVKHVVLVSSMAGTKPDHFLNACMDNIVLWKRKAECYLKNSGMPYTIIHPGGLLPHPPAENTPAPGGKRQLYLGVDDTLMDDERKISNVPREDVAEICVQCVLNPSETKGRAFDLGSGPETEEKVTVDVKELLRTLGPKNTEYKPEDALFKPESGKRDEAKCGLCSSK